MILLDIRSPIIPSSTNPIGLIVAGILLSIAVFFLGRLLWKRGQKS
ncbi:MAG TPA: hypothetical protein VEU96_33290 [Bryobacteraceae bacterium]|nr:hypothetical protein [Bryobacteraceae bacterium]